jgi:class 3 adenylate cyclase
VLFTDVVGSTQLAAELGDRAWKALLEQHNGLVRALLRRYHGREIGTAGDSFTATLDGPARAVRCALAISQAVRPLGLQVRAGLHTGEVETIGTDIGGIAVHIGARVSALAGPDEVLVSSTVKELVTGSGLSFADAGEHQLKGAPDTWHLYRVVGWNPRGRRTRAP